MKRIEVVAKTVESAVEKGLSELGITREQADIQILSEGGFLKQSKVLVSQKMTPGQKAVQFLEKLVNKMRVTCIVELFETEDEIRLELIGTDTSMLIGYRGETLDALQYLASLVANKDAAVYKRVVMDTEDYRAKRITALEQLAKNLENKVIRTNRPAKLEPMNSFERRIIHSTLQNSEKVTTASEGIDPSRYVVILPKGASKKAVPGKKPHSFVYRSDKKRDGKR